MEQTKTKSRWVSTKAAKHFEKIEKLKHFKQNLNGIIKFCDKQLVPRQTFCAKKKKLHLGSGRRVMPSTRLARFAWQPLGSLKASGSLWTRPWTSHRYPRSSKRVGHLVTHVTLPCWWPFHREKLKLGYSTGTSNDKKSSKKKKKKKRLQTPITQLLQL